MHRSGDSLVFKSEFLIIRDLLLQTGQNDAPPPFLFRIGDAPVYQLSGTSPVPVFRYGVEPEDHLPVSLRIMEGGIGKHGIGELRGTGDHAVQKSHQGLSVPQQPESFRIGPETVPELLLRRRLFRRKTSGLHGSHCLQIRHRSLSYLHHPSSRRLCTALAIRSMSTNMLLPPSRRTPA